MFSKFIPVETCVNNIPLYVDTTLKKITFICLMVTWVISTFYLFWIMLLAFTWKCLFESLFSCLLGGILRVSGIAGAYVILCLAFWGTALLCPTAAASLYIPTSSVWGFQFLYILVNICHFLLLLLVFLFNCSGFKVLWHCGFDLHFLSD